MLHATALFADRHTAHAAVDQLVQAGFPRDALSVAMSEETHEREFAGPSSSRSALRSARYGVLGAVVAGLVVFASAGASLRTAGPLVTALHRTGALPSALVALGLDEGNANAVDEGLRDGSIFVGVRAADDQHGLAIRLLQLSGGAALQAA